MASQCSLNRAMLRLLSQLLVTVALLVVPAALAQAPVPFISLPLVPDATAPGRSNFTLTVNGTGFVSGSVVNWNGSPRPTTFLSGSQLTAEISAADIVTPSTASVTVVNPQSGGGTSNVMLFTVTTDTGARVSFDAPISVPGGSWEWSLAVGDFNVDGKLDLAVVNMLSSTVSILLGDGKGSFTLSSSLPAFQPGAAAVGDFDGDGKLDVAVANDNYTVSIFLGDGTGKFTLASNAPIGSYGCSIAVADLNADGKLDLAVANCGSDTASILLGDGTGKFAPASTLKVGSWPRCVAVGDFNRDGKLDLAVANQWSDTVSILLGDGTGNFTLASSPATNGDPWTLVVADFNRDGKLDLAVANFTGNSKQTVSILLGDGSGNFSMAQAPDAGSPAMGLTAADFNGDGNLDLAVANYPDNTVSILLGDGTGNFIPGSSFPAGADAYSAVVGDFNGDGRMDFALANWDNSTVSILLNNTPLCTAPPVVTVSATPRFLWPPNGKMVPITVSGTTTDTSTGCTINTAAYAVKDEYGEVQLSGPVTLGTGGAYTFTVWLQASRLGTDLDGRLYTVTVSASNNAGKTGSQSGTVIVPHDQGH